MKPVFDPQVHKQHEPFSLTIDVTSGCSLRCDFCGVKGVYARANQYDHMTVETGRKVAERLAESGWNPRITFGCFGEPTENPNLAEIVAAVREASPKASLMMLANGSGLVKDAPAKFAELHDAGLNVICVEDYRGVKFLPKILEQGVEFDGRYPDDISLNPQQRWSPRTRKSIIINDLRENAGTGSSHTHINNHCGVGAPPNDKGEGKRCTRPFRDFVVRWDGNVPGCCNDWRMVYLAGNIYQQSFEEIWQGPGFYALRQKMYYGERDFGPCLGCDLMGTRVGLLPDPQGQMTMARPTVGTQRALAACLRHEPLTPVVLRPWELPVLQ